LAERQSQYGAELAYTLEDLEASKAANKPVDGLDMSAMEALIEKKRGGDDAVRKVLDEGETMLESLQRQVAVDQIYSKGPTKVLE